MTRRMLVEPIESRVMLSASTGLTWPDATQSIQFAPLVQPISVAPPQGTVPPAGDGGYIILDRALIDSYEPTGLFTTNNAVFNSGPTVAASIGSTIDVEIRLPGYLIMPVERPINALTGAVRIGSLQSPNDDDSGGITPLEPILKSSGKLGSDEKLAFPQPAMNSESTGGQVRPFAAPVAHDNAGLGGELSGEIARPMIFDAVGGELSPTSLLPHLRERPTGTIAPEQTRSPASAVLSPSDGDAARSKDGFPSKMAPAVPSAPGTSPLRAGDASPVVGPVARVLLTNDPIGLVGASLPLASSNDQKSNENVSSPAHARLFAIQEVDARPVGIADRIWETSLQASPLFIALALEHLWTTNWRRRVDETLGLDSNTHCQPRARRQS